MDDELVSDHHIVGGIKVDKQTEGDKKANIKVPCEVYSRIVGYLRPVQAWNDGKKAEFGERKTFDVHEVAQE